MRAPFTFASRIYNDSNMEKRIQRLEDMPQALTYLIDKVDSLEQKVTELSVSHTSEPSKQKEWMNITELCQYLPTHPAKQTVYGWVNDKQIPYYKQSKKLTFLKSEIDDWMKGGSRKSREELEREAAEYIAGKRNRNFSTEHYGNHRNG
jgi:excisionase family DNA binding protein